MLANKIVISLLIVIFFSFISPRDSYQRNFEEEKFVSFIVHPKKLDVALYWKDDSGNLIRNFSNLLSLVSSKNKQLIFAMNAGMYQENNTPLGLFINRGHVVTALNKKSGYGNFYLKPNGVFYLDTANKAFIKNTDEFILDRTIKYATQSGPMLVTNGVVHRLFSKSSKNLNIRNGVGILADGRILFAMSKTQISFYDFACFFKNAGCINALYLDGFVSRTFYPAKNWLQYDGNFGVMIGVTAPK